MCPEKIAERDIKVILMQHALKLHLSNAKDLFLSMNVFDVEIAHGGSPKIECRISQSQSNT